MVEQNQGHYILPHFGSKSPLPGGRVDWSDLAPGYIFAGFAVAEQNKSSMAFHQAAFSRG
jgi:hypothetical protein